MTRLRLLLAVPLLMGACQIGSESGSPIPTPSSTASAGATATAKPVPSETPSRAPTATTVALPPDVDSVGTARVATATESAEAISRSEAIAAATDQGYSWPDPEAFLVVMTSPTTDSSDEPIVDRLVWLLRWEELMIPFPRPSRLAGTYPPEQPSTVFVLLDGHDGEFLFAHFEG